MKQKISIPVAIAIVAVIAALLMGFMYKKYVYQTSYSVQDVAARYREAGKARGGVPPYRQQPSQR